MDGIYFRLALLVVGLCQVMITALMGFAEFLPLEWKIVLTVVTAGLVFLSNQLPSIQGAPHAARVMRRARPPAD
jgi:hypothetical protein